MIEINPYKLCLDFNRRYQRLGKDLYMIVDEPVRMKLKNKPIAACNGKHWALDADGTLTLDVGYIWNGANVVQDATCKMLASAVHDVLCLKEAVPQYNYFRRQLIYRDIMRAQGGGWLLSNIDLVGTVLGQWLP